MALSKKELRRIISEVPVPETDDVGAWVVGVARAIEAEVRRQDEALIRQMLEALEQSQPFTEACANGRRVQWWGAQLDRAQTAIDAARARLTPPTA